MTFDEGFALALSDMCMGWEALKPPLRVSVSEGASQTLIIKQPGASGGPWSAAETPYMVEPMNMLASRKHEAVVFVGPARTGKTAGLLLGWMGHNVVNDPGDMLFIQMTKEKAREFSKTDVDRAIRNSPKIAAMRGTRAIDSNTFDSMFRHGMFLRIAWPTVSNVSGSTYRYVAITDLDRMENAENVDGEGPLFDLARKRTTTFLSRGMCLAESSPGIEVEIPNWRPSTPHEGPPVSGIVGLYNLSDRRRWYWQCPDCYDWFEAAPGLELFNLPHEQELIESVRSISISKMAAEWGSRVICPCCGSLIDAKWKQTLNNKGTWLAEGQIIDTDGNKIGEAAPATTAGYWLGGVAAAYQKWSSLVERYLQGLRDYSLTGSEEKLKTTVNTDQGLPYTSRRLLEAQSSVSDISERTNGELQRYVVTEDTRCLVASVDVQGGATSRFVVQVHAVGAHMEQWLVDRFEIRESKREGMGGRFAPIDPAGYPEDWDVLTDKLLNATWRTPTEGLEMRLKLLIVDSGGEDGVSHNAYAWYRRLRREGLHKRVMLYKGSNQKTAPIIKETLVGKINNKGKADVPLHVCNPNLLADSVDSGLRRATPGPGFIHFPPPKHPKLNPDGWLPQAFFDELKAEVRQPNGVWKQVRKRNETFDLCKMVRAGLLVLKLDKIRDWSSVPSWLAPLDMNSEIVTVEDRRDMKENERIEHTDDTPQPAPAVRVIPTKQVRKKRRSVASPYLR
jgi:phage terminase large subunit GpA-like protein